MPTSKRWPVVGLILLMIALTRQDVLAQSTTKWLPVTEGGVAATTPASPSLGASYLTLTLVSARIYQSSNWWTNFVERNRTGVITAALSGQVNGRQFADTRSSAPIELRKDKSQVDTGWSQLLVERLPTTYTNLSLTITLSKTAKDGLNDLISMLSSLSQAAPALQVSQTTTGIVSAAKSIADFLFNKSLIVPRLNSTIQFPSSGQTLPAGLYACIAGDSASDYDKLLQRGSLKWTNSLLFTADDKPLSRLSYFIVRIEYPTRVFDKPESALSLTYKPWSALYQIAVGEAAGFADLSQRTKMADEIRDRLLNGNTLLDADPDYIQVEREEIKVKVRDIAQDWLNKRIAALTPPPTPTTTAASGGGGGVPGSPVLQTAPGTGGTVVAPPPNLPTSPVLLIVPDDKAAKSFIMDSGKAAVLVPPPPK